MCDVLQHCRACGQTKAAEDFPRNRMNKDGLHSYCKPCQNAKCAQYQKNSVAAKQDSRASIESPFEAPADQPFSSHKVFQDRVPAELMLNTSLTCIHMQCSKQNCQLAKLVKVALPYATWQARTDVGMSAVAYSLHVLRK